MSDRTNMTGSKVKKDYARTARNTNTIYLYDGTYDGLLSCVFESFASREIPADILCHDTEQTFLHPVKHIETNSEYSNRVSNSISIKISAEAEDFIQCSFLTCLPNKEILILKFFYLGYRYGKGVLRHLTDDTINTLFKAVKHLKNEAHLLSGFIRFSVHNQILVSMIKPKNEVLPLLKDHFCQRYPNESFMIYDENHHMALIYRPFQSVIVPIDNFEISRPDDQEIFYQQLWKLFYDSIAIEGRFNPKCRMSHMPKRYWDYMTEFNVSDNSLPENQTQNFLEK